jgi:hypothetical protein
MPKPMTVIRHSFEHSSFYFISMIKSAAIASRLREVFLDGRWVANTNYREQLEDLDLHKATGKIGDLNTIALLTYHINYYVEGLLKAYNTGILEIRDRFSFDMPGLNTDIEWKAMVKNLLENAEEFAAFVEKMDDAELDRPFIEEKYGTNLRNIEAVIEHSYYHLGQISLVKKFLNQGIQGK